MRSYATFGAGRSWRQLRHTWRARSTIEVIQREYLVHVRTAEERISRAIGRPLQGLEVLEVGPGQGRERAFYFGSSNEVTTIDLDLIPRANRPAAYWRIAQANGVGRAVKTLGRHVVIGRRSRTSWAKVIGVPRLREPHMLRGDICQTVPGAHPFDVVTSWSVFEHLDDPAAALRNVIAALRPGGVLYISIHLYTSNNGHHDIRSFTGDGDAVPLWAHLRPATRGLVHPSAFLNEWRLAQWRSLFSDLAPGHVEHLDQYEHPAVYGPKLQGDLRRELADYTDEELLTVNVVYCWRKPAVHVGDVEQRRPYEQTVERVERPERPDGCVPGLSKVSWS